MIIHLLPEGYLEEAAGRRLIAHCGHELGTMYNKRRGCAYIRDHAVRFRFLAAGDSGVLILTDFRDAGAPCLPSALQSYLGSAAANPAPSFLCRFAVNELESWLMADRQGLASFLSVSADRVPREPEREAFPKQTLVNIARHSKKKSIKEGVAPPPGHHAAVGPEYSSMMDDFITRHWDVEAAMAHSPSLARCVRRLRELAGG